MRSLRHAPFMVLLAVGVPALAVAQAEPKKPAPGAEPATHAMVMANAVTFQPLDIPGFAPGVKLAVIHGDPNAESGDFTIRLSFPDGYKFPAHWHPNAEHLTVLEGSLLLGVGDKPDDTKLQSLPVGAFMYVPGKVSHFGGAKGATIIQIHGMAPFKIELTKPM